MPTRGAVRRAVVNAAACLPACGRRLQASLSPAACTSLLHLCNTTPPLLSPSLLSPSLAPSFLPLSPSLLPPSLPAPSLPPSLPAPFLPSSHSGFLLPSESESFPRGSPLYPSHKCLGPSSSPPPESSPSLVRSFLFCCGGYGPLRQLSLLLLLMLVESLLSSAFSLHDEGAISHTLDK